MTTYTIYDGNSPPQTGLSLIDAAEEILTADGQEFEIRPDTNCGFRLWQRKEVANVKWRKTVIFSWKSTLDVARLDIFQRVIDAAISGRWDRYTQIMTDSDYAAMEAKG